jgi:ELWxxDGT repeat protein
VKDVNTFLGSGQTSSDVVDVGGTAFYLSSSPTTGIELWKSDGTELGTVLVKDIWLGSRSSLDSSNWMTNVNGALYFVADDGASGRELWKSDGTEAGTVRVKDMRPGSRGAFRSLDLLTQSLTNVNGKLFFLAGDFHRYTAESTTFELWKSDGTEIGTLAVNRLSTGSMGSYPNDLTNINGSLYFSAFDVDDAPYFTRQKYWKSDGTESGTDRVNEMAPVKPIGIAVNGTVYYSAHEGDSGSELWKTDGTPGGTIRVKDIIPGAFSSYPHYLINVDGILYFSAYGEVRDRIIVNRELWKSDGTEAGTVRVKDIWPGPEGSYPRHLTNVNGVLYLIANDGINGIELWKSDGTDAGTVRVKDIRSGNDSSFPNHFTNSNGVLYFSANNGIDGAELWKSDGTEAGTVLVKDTGPGEFSGSPTNLSNVNGALYFSANDGIHGDELWTSDGTAEGTVLVSDLVAGTGGSNPGPFTEVNGKLFFPATDDLHGRELWVADLALANDDRNLDGVIDLQDLEAICTAIVGGSAARDDINAFWSRQKTGPGDANFDRLFDTSDLVSVFQRGKYETNSPATWSDGDWNCDGLFGTADLVAAFQRGWYESGPVGAIVTSLSDNEKSTHRRVRSITTRIESAISCRADQD